MQAPTMSQSRRSIRAARAQSSTNGFLTCSLQLVAEVSSERSMSRAATRKRGEEIARHFGLDTAPSPVPGLDDFMAEAIYAGIWGRPHLAPADRAICALATLSSLQRLPSLQSMVAT